jgi:hypothetical protein
MFKSLATLAAIAAVATAAPSRLHRRTDIDADEVVGFSQSVPDNTEGTLMLQYQPYIYVVDGCVPFPAVDAEGDTR